MAESYCGKSCAECREFTEQRCPGCKDGPGAAWSGDCTIAGCCRSKDHANCETCTQLPSCRLNAGRYDMPGERRQRGELAAQRRERAAAHAKRLSRWLNLLFWLVIVRIIVVLIGNDTVQELAPGLYWPSLVLGWLYSACYGAILLILSPANARYRTAGAILLAVTAVDVASVFAVDPDGPFIILAGLAVVILQLVGEYNELYGHSEVLEGVDDGLSENWRYLWKWQVYAFIAIIGGALLAAAFAIIGLICVLLGTIALLVVSVMKLVYVWRTAKAFKKIVPDD